MTRLGEVTTVKGIVVSVATQGGPAQFSPEYLHPYDPEVAEIERMAKAMYYRDNNKTKWKLAVVAPRYRDLARVARAAMKK